MRFSRLYDAEGGFSERGPDGLLEDRQAGVPQDEPVPLAGGAQTTPSAPSADPAPGPNGNPAPQGGNPSPPQPPPPAVVSSVPGIKGSETTGGVQGSFAQAGSSDFSRRFGAPAAWFNSGARRQDSSQLSDIGRQSHERMREISRASRSGSSRGGQLAGGGETVANVPDPSSGPVGGGQNDEEFQRMLQAVLRNRFQR